MNQSIQQACEAYKIIDQTTVILTNAMNVHRQIVANLTHEEYAEYIKITNEYITSRNQA